MASSLQHQIRGNNILHHFGRQPQDKGGLGGIFLLGGLFAGLSGVAQAGCGLALALAIDVSGSVDPEEYQIQMKGLADALRDTTVAAALVRTEAAISVVLWTGSSRQSVTVPWTLIVDFNQLDEIAAQIETAPRPWRHFSTAIGEALEFTVASFAAVPACVRKVIDVSGDGYSNEGVEPSALRSRLYRQGFVVNGLAIEGSVEDLTGYYWENVIVGEGAFVMTADSFEDDAERIRRKLLREVTQVVARLR